VSSQTENSNSTQIFQHEGIIVDNNDNLYVNDIQSNEIKKYDINGNFILKWGHQTVNGIPLDHPHSSEIDKQGNIYITDQK
jgi:sugar lactone lactonase YvrE